MRSTPMVLCAAALLVAASSCASGGARSDHLDGPTYSSLEELTLGSDVVVTGSFGDVVREVTERELIGEGGDFVGDDAGLVAELAQLDGIDAALEEVAAIADRTAAGPRDTE